MNLFTAAMPTGSRLRLALGACALIILSVSATLVTVQYYHSRYASNGERISTAQGGERNLAAALRSIQHAEQEYLDAIRVLSAIVDKRKASLEPSLLAEMEANLRAIDESIAATRKAYQAHPSDPELAQFMLAAYSRKVELLLDLASI